MRYFEKAKGYEHIEFELPKRSTKNSAGYDIAIVEDVCIKARSVVLAPTGLKAFMEHDEVLQLFARSSLPRKYSLMLPNSVGIIDSDYYGNIDNDGAIFVQLYNFGDKEITLKKGERVAQGIFTKYLIVSNEEEIKNVREGGFGSTD